MSNLELRCVSPMRFGSSIYLQPQQLRLQPPVLHLEPDEHQTPVISLSCDSLKPQEQGLS